MTIRPCTVCGTHAHHGMPWSEWNALHRVQHLAAFPDLDEGSKRNFDQFVDEARQREGLPPEVRQLSLGPQ